MSQNTSAADYWQFSLAVYGQQGVAAHCLQLQRRLGLDVNVLLLMLWAAGQWGRAPTAEQIADADSSISQWRQQIVLPLRQLRTRLKHGPSPAPDIMTDELRQDIKRLELNAERIEQDVLAQWVKQQSVVIGEQKADEHGIALATAGLEASPDAESAALQNAKPDASQSIQSAASPSAQSVASAASRPHNNGSDHQPGSPAPLADTTENAHRLAVLEQTAVRVVAHYEAQCAQSAAEGVEDAEETPDPWLALQHAHQIVLAAAGVLH
ncbi:MAG: TIGR02444 family protein [Advenella sp.]|uniref:TIGR02444 family protein n=1 Tax=Advenella sp. S44 TaxID=1982755 RepID=UPI0013747B95|nr:TIGR02444 family protein [Advenella sp. S44]